MKASDKKILIVDDHQPSIFLLDAALQADGFCNIIQCDDSRQVITILSQQPVAVILLDLHMPHLPGEELLEIIVPIYPDIPVIVVTGTNEVDTVVRCIKKGAFDYLVKPIEKSRLVTTVSNAMTVQGLRDENKEIRQRAKQQILKMAFYDSVTGLPNRYLVKERLEQAIKQAKRRDNQLAVLSLDLDHFKHINDTLGDQVGDAVLIEIGKRISVCIREADSLGRNLEDPLQTTQWQGGNTVARIGGDEFVVLIDEINRPDDAAIVAHRIQQVITQPINLDDRDLCVSSSIGISSYPEDGEDATSLLKNADAAMSHAKKEGRDRYQFFTNEINIEVRRRLELESELRRGLTFSDFTLYYQPKVSLASGKITGAEALVRWQHPNKGIISPAKFIPLAEETGLIIPLGEWILNTACSQIKTWQVSGVANLSVSVNISAVQFRQRDLTDTVAEAISAANINPQLLELELTESILIDDIETTLKQLQELKLLGVKISIDDFGTGYSSLSYLKRFPIDVLKIDQSFVSDIKENTNDPIINAVISLARSLELKTIAEGVENEQQLNYLLQQGCDEIQGYLLSKPLPATEFIQNIEKITIIKQSSSIIEFEKPDKNARVSNG